MSRMGFIFEAPTPIMEIADLILESQIEKLSSKKYPKDLGSWGILKEKIDELKRHLSKLVVELKIYDIFEDEFPSLKGKGDFVELELKSSISDAKKVHDVLRRLKAFELEKYHIINLNKKLFEEKLDEEKLDKESVEKKSWFPAKESLRYFA